MSTAHGSPAQRQRRRRQTAEWSTASTMSMRWGPPLRRRRRRARCNDDNGDGLRGLLGLCIGDFFFFFWQTPLCSVLYVSVFGLLICWVLWFWFAFVLGNGDWSLPGQRRDGIFAGADVMGSISILCFFFLFFFYFLLRNCGLAVSELPVMGSPWASLAVGFDWTAWFCFCFFFFFFRF